MNLPYFIARRYLFAKKSHQVINIISLISAIGILVGTAALIITLSIYNGFQDFISGMYGRYEADLMICPQKGKTIRPDSTLILDLRKDPAVSYICPVIQDNAFLSYDGTQGIALVRGVDSLYQKAHDVYGSLIEGDFELYYGEIPQAIIGTILAREMHIRPRFLDPLEIYYPHRNRKFSPSNPMGSINRNTVFPIGRISIDQKLDKSLVIIPIKSARELMGYAEDEYSYLDIMLTEDADAATFQKKLDARYGKEYQLLSRYQQNETLYKMMSYEKIAIYMILLFIIAVISFNVFGSLTMLIIEKTKDISILRSMGADYPLIRRIFVSEGWMICLLGMISGLLLGVALSLIQQHFGILKMPGNFAIKAYPVIVEISDIVTTFFTVGIIGLIISLLPTIKVLPSIYKKVE